MKSPFPFKGEKSSHSLPAALTSLFQVLSRQQCILTACSSSQRRVIDERAVTLTACVNNPHSSAIKGDRGSLNHCNMQTGLQWQCFLWMQTQTHTYAVRKYKQCACTNNTLAFAFALPFCFYCPALCFYSSGIFQFQFYLSLQIFGFPLLWLILLTGGEVELLKRRERGRTSSKSEE